jgi:AcrR family transcriptional regulator
MPDESPDRSSRRWRGKTAEERRAARREQLIEAGIELFGTRGYAATSVKAVCDQAGLTERYFYEAFPDREGLLITIYDMLIEDAAAATLKAMDEAGPGLRQGMKAALTGFATHVTSDPRKARIQEIEVIGVSATLEERRRSAIHAFASLIAAKTKEFGGQDRDGPVRLDVVALGLVGAVNEQLIDYVLGHLDISLEDLVANQVAMFRAVADKMMP